MYLGCYVNKLKLLLTEGSHSPRKEGALQSGGTALKSSFRINKTILNSLQLLELFTYLFLIYCLLNTMQNKILK